jgi:hypothetical protein
VAAYSFNRGAETPLLSVWQRASVLAGAALLAACSLRTPPLPFTASGYVADGGVVRIWRKDDASGGVHLFTAFSPWYSGETATGEYRWQGENLMLAQQTTYGKPPQHIKIRFDERGGLSFMQREVNGQKQQLSDDSIALWRYRAQQVRATSDALHAGRVELYQGRWQGEGSVVNCEGQRLRPALNDAALKRIRQRQANSSMAVSVAWLEAPEGAQLLLVANENYCSWQPDPKSF